MKRGKFVRSSAVLASVLGVIVPATGAFAANDISMSYSGGSVLDSTKVNLFDTTGYTQLMGSAAESTLNRVTGSKWADGYIKVGSCHPVKYLRVGNTSGAFDPQSDTASVEIVSGGGKYRMEVSIEDVQFKNLPSDTTLSIAIDSGRALHIGYGLYEDQATCESESVIDGISTLNAINREKSAGDETDIFVNTRVKFYKGSSTTPFVVNGADGTGDLYIAFEDMDALQSYMIMNSGNEFSPTNMFATDTSAEYLQPTSGEGANMYVSDGNKKYIYSTYGNVEGPTLYTKLTPATQRDGINVVFGDRAAATTTLRYLARQYTVNYVSDPNGTIPNTELTTEKVFSGDNPTGSNTTPKRDDTSEKDYTFLYWVPDVDVTLTDGTTRKANVDHMTYEEVKSVIVDQDITFKAYHDISYRVIYESDPYGEITGITDEDVWSGNNPAGSTEEAVDKYEIDYWTADVDVTLDDGTVIKAGDHITAEEIVRVVVDRDIKFKAFHKAKSAPVTPNTGDMSEVGKGHAAMVFGLTLPIIIATLSIAGFCKIKRHSSNRSEID